MDWRDLPTEVDTVIAVVHRRTSTPARWWLANPGRWVSSTGITLSPVDLAGTITEFTEIARRIEEHR